MARRPSASEHLAMKAAAAAARQSEPDDESDASTVPLPLDLKGAEADAKRPPGRPKGRRAVAARQTIYLDEKRYDALLRIAGDRGRSVHSLLLEGVDLVIGKPQRPGWSVE